DAVYSVAFSPDGKMLASGSDDEMVKLWDVETNANTATLEGHTDAVYSVAFSPDGKMLASGGGTFDETVKLWDVETNANIATLEGHEDGVSSVAFSPDGTMLASGVGDAFFPEFFPESSDNRVKLWDVASGEPIASLGGHTGEVWSVAFSPDGTMLASAGGTFDNRVKLWDVASGEPIATLEGHMDVVSSVAFLSDGTRLAARSGYSAVAFSSDVTRLATGSDNAILVWDVDSGDQTTSLGGHALSPDGTRLAAVSENGKILLWDVDSGERITTLEGHAGGAEAGTVSLLAFSPDGTRLASGSGLFGDYAILLWDVDSGERIATLEGHTGGPWGAISALAFSPDGTRLASASFDTESFDGTMLLVWDVDTGERTATLVEGRRLGGQWGEISSLTFSPDGTRLAAGSGNTIPLWDVETNTNITTLEGHADWVNSVSFSPDGATLASGAGDGTILLWDVAEWTNSGTAVAANKLIGLPDELQLQQNAPNPFNSQTVLSYFLPKSGPVRLELFSVTGQRVAILRQEHQEGGYYRLHWNGRDREGRSLASGMYLYRLVTDEGILTRKLTLLR
ncbi:MAG: T9SS type A sorting domain-containing protein, partial [Rhodothermaceae bacterium]|nr:T9SS type A sorting domain-containing protein [Rhodothermaceae bacterium]